MWGALENYTAKLYLRIDMWGCIIELYRKTVLI